MQNIIIDKAGCNRINPNQTVFVNGISSSGKTQAMVKGNDKLDGVSKKIEQDHEPIKRAMLNRHNQHLQRDSQDDDVMMDRIINDANDAQQNEDQANSVVVNDDEMEEMDEIDISMRDMTPFVSVDEAKKTSDSRVDISYNRRRFTDVCNLIFSI